MRYDIEGSRYVYVIPERWPRAKRKLQNIAEPALPIPITCFSPGIDVKNPCVGCSTFQRTCPSVCDDLIISEAKGE
jgi:hypothetical protein